MLLCIVRLFTALATDATCNSEQRFHCEKAGTISSLNNVVKFSTTPKDFWKLFI